MALTALLFALLFVVTYWLPGRLVWGLVRGPKRDLEAPAFSVGLGIVFVNLLVTFVHGLAIRSFSDAALSRWVVVGSGLAVAVFALGYGVIRRGWRPSRALFRLPSTPRIALACLSALSFGFYLLYFDVDQLSESCGLVELASPFSAPQDDPASGSALFAVQRLGTSLHGHRWASDVLVSPFLALFGPFGFRLLYALQGLLLPALGFALGHAVIRRRWAAWVAALTLTFNPFSLESQMLDESFLALVFGSLSLALLVRERAPLNLVGATLAFYLGIRPAVAPLLLVVVWFVWRTRDAGRVASTTPAAGRLPRPRHPLRGLVGGLATVGALYLALFITRLVITGEGSESAPPRLASHDVIGLGFGPHRLLNFPFVEAPVRSPYHAFPALLLHPLDLLRRFGLLLVALVAPGLAFLWRERRPTLALLVGWFAPTLAAVMVQSSGSAVVELNLPAAALSPVIVIMVAGIAWLLPPAPRWWARALVVAAGVALPFGFWAAVGTVETSLDRRIHVGQFCASPGKLEEEPVYLPWERDRFRPGSLPSLRHDSWSAPFARSRLRQLGLALAQTDMASYQMPMVEYVRQYILGRRDRRNDVSNHHLRSGGERRPPLPPAADPRPAMTVALDMNAPPALAQQPVQLTPERRPLLRVDGRTIHVVRGLRTPWSSEPITLTLALDAAGVVHVVTLPTADTALSRPPGVDVVEHDGRQRSDLTLPVALPEGSVLRFLTTPDEATARSYLRYVAVTEDGVTLTRTEVVRW